MSEHNAPTLKIYLGVLISLMIGTVLTVAAGQQDLGHAGNVVIGLGIAIIKASLVAMFFMQMKYEHRAWAGLILFPLLLVTIILCANLPDTGLNGPHRNGEFGLTTPAVTKPHQMPGDHGHAPATPGEKH